MAECRNSTGRDMAHGGDVDVEFVYKELYRFYLAFP